MGRQQATFDLQAPGYTPNRLLNKIMEVFEVRKDAGLARILNCHQSQLSRFRKREERISDRVLLRIVDRTNLSIRTVRGWAGMPSGCEVVAAKTKPKFKLTDAQVVEIRSSTGSVSATAKKYGISASYVLAIRKGRYRKNVEAVRT